MASISGFGQTGPYAQRPAYDVIAQAMGGIMSLTGHPGGPPTRVGSSTGDITAGLFTAVGILAALAARERSGRGTRVDVAMLDAQVATLENAIVRYLASGEVPGPLGSRHPSIAPFQALATGDGFIVVAAGNDALFAKLCRALERPELAQHPDFASNELRTRHAEALARSLEQALARHGSAHWLATLEAAGIPSGPVNDVAQVVADPQVAARNMLVGVAGAALRVAGNPIKLSGFADPSERSAAPELDEGRARILAELGGADPG
jgi:CoA:oxalate CoA-transferase